MEEVIDNYLREIRNIIGEINPEQIQNLVNILEKSRLEGKRIFILGNGGSATTANHFVCDFGKNTIKGDTGRFKIISLCDNLATITAYGNDFGYETIFEERLKNLMENKDVIIAISTSGNSKNVLNAVKYAKSRDAYIVSFTGANGGKLRALSDINISINSSEVEKIEDAHLIIEHIVVCCYKYNNVRI